MNYIKSIYANDKKITPIWSMEFVKFNILYGHIEKYATLNNNSDNLLVDSIDVECVYMINDFYIGRTNNLMNRIMTHITDALELNIENANVEKIKLSRALLDAGLKFNFTILSTNQKDEKRLICEYYDNGYTNLVNIQFLKQHIEKITGVTEARLAELKNKRNNTRKTKLNKKV